MKKLLSLLLSLVLIVSSVLAPSVAFAGDGFYSNSNVDHCVVHDPSIIRGEDNRYYMFGSHLVMSESDDLINWKNNDFDIQEGHPTYFGDWKNELAEPLSWCDKYQEQTHKNDNSLYQTFEKNCWANDAIYNPHTGEYLLYGCCSVWGTTASVIWVATSKNINGPYKYQKSFVYSGVTNNAPNTRRYNGLYYADTNIQTDIVGKYMDEYDVKFNYNWFDHNTGYYRCGWGDYPNAIDPTAFFDANGDLWLVYGSFSGGCFVLKMDNETGTPDYEYMSKAEGYDVYYGKQISRTNADTDGTGEGPFIIYDDVSGYYYFFLTYGGLGGHGGYNIREYRSTSPEGPYVDAAGYDAMETHNTGVKLIGNYGFASTASPYVSPGHSSCLIDKDGSMYQAFHTRFAKDNGWGFQTRVHKMARTTDGWAVILPMEYQGEKDDVLTSKDIIGDWEFVDFTNISHANADDANIYDIVVPTQHITLNEDGTISGAKKYNCKREFTDLGSTSVNGTWTLENDGVNAKFTIGNTNYVGVFARQYDESSEASPTVVFSAKGDDNSSIWGVSMTNLSHNASVIEVVKPTCTSKGYSVYKCENCDYSYKANYVAMLEHNLQITESVAPSCTQNGYTSYKCVDCDFTSTEYANSISHNIITSITPATISKNGKKIAHCSDCDFVSSTSTIYYPKEIKLSTTKYTYDGKAKLPSVKVIGDNGKAIPSSYYDVTYPSGRKNVGEYTVKIKFKGSYTGSTTRSFTIAPKSTSISKLTSSSKGFKATWKKQATQTTGYQIQYSTSSKFTSPKSVTVSKNSTTSKSVTKLKAKKKYYVRVRTYKTVSGTKYYSSWSSSKSVTTKK